MSLPQIERDGETYRATFDDTWLQGRTAYGGATAAIALSIIKAAFTDLPTLRSTQIAFVGPLSGEVRASPVLLRRGKNSAFIACDLTSGDGVGLRTLFLFMAPRTSGIDYLDLPAPDAGIPEERLVDPSQLPQGFLAKFDLSKSGDDKAGFTRWVRLKDRAGLDPEVELVAIADALPPAAMVFAPTWGPVSTTTWQLNLVTDAPTTRDGWWLIADTTLHAGNGTSSQSMTIWNRDGEAVATATQSIALFI